jgi:hypothetical protein
MSPDFNVFGSSYTTVDSPQLAYWLSYLPGRSRSPRQERYCYGQAFSGPKTTKAWPSMAHTDDASPVYSASQPHLGGISR